MQDGKKPVEQIAQELSTSLSKGLSMEEGSKRLAQEGPNRLPERRKVLAWKLLLEQFASVVIWLLIGAAGVAGFLGEMVDAGAILVIVLLNALLGFFQEYRAERSLEALQKLAAPMSKVIRGGVLQNIPAEKLVRGDLILLEAGDRVPADGRIVHQVHLVLDEASLTGESLPVSKTEEVLLEEKVLADQKNRVFLGTQVVSGKGHVLLTATGVATEMGKIASTLAVQEKEKTPLQRQLDRLGHHLFFLCLGVVAVVFGLGMLRGLNWVDMLLLALSLAVAAIPEGLPAAVTIALSIGVQKMAREKGLIRRLSSVETLGCTSVICTDKTGTLTQNAMTVRYLFADGQRIGVTGHGYAPEGTFTGGALSPAFLELLRTGVLCSNANLFQEEGQWKVAGDPTEGALLTAAAKAGLFKDELEHAHPLLQEIPFDSARKRMSCLRKGNGGGETLFVKGALDVLLPRATSIWMEGRIQPLSQAKRKEIERVQQELAKEAYRVLALAQQTDLSVELETHLVFVGLVAMRDPPREEVKGAIQQCKQAGIETVMITGDHKETAVAVAKELGLLEEGQEAIDGAEFERLTDEELLQRLDKTRVFSRISPEDKLRIIEALKKEGKVIAMTGDGVNDAPALKAADIGVAMGITGTDVTKESADMVILDDNFASIVKAIERGRGIYDNIVKFLTYLLSSNLAEVLVLFIAMALGLKGDGGAPLVALLPVQLLWINLVTDGLPAISLALDPIDPRAMQKKPRKKSEPILHRKVSLYILAISLLVTLGTLGACFYGLQEGSQKAQTMTFTTLIVLEMVPVQMIRKQYGLSFFSNPMLLFALASSLVLQLLVLYVPALQVVFRTMPLGGLDWAVMAGIGLCVFWMGEGINRLFGRGSSES